MSPHFIPGMCLLSLSLWLGGIQSALATPPPIAPFVQADEPASLSDYVLPDYIRRPVEPPASISKRTPLGLTRSEAVETALRKNLGLLLQREQVLMTDTARGAALAAFEPLVGLSIGRSSSQEPPLTAQDGQEGQVLPITIDQWDLNLRTLLPTGASLQLDFLNTRTDSALGSAVAPRLFRATAALSLSQPLLRHFSWSGRVQWASVLRAGFDSESARLAAVQQATATVKATEDAYWALVSAWKVYAVKRGAYALLKSQLELTRRKIAAGTLPESESITVESNLAQKQVDVLGWEAKIDEAADRLRQLLNLPREQWEQPLLPLDVPSFTRVPFALDTAMERALATRPELKQADVDIRRGALDLEVACNERLPQLNINGSMALVGQNQAYDQTLAQVGSGAGWQWTAGLELGWAPLGVGARAGVAHAQSGVRRNALLREQLLVQIRTELRAAGRSLDTAERTLYAAVTSRDLAERSLDVEQRRFLNGLAPNFQVAQRQAELEGARLAELQALIQHEMARSELLRAMGELLEARHLHFEVRHHG